MLLHLGISGQRNLRMPKKEGKKGWGELKGARLPSQGARGKQLGRSQVKYRWYRFKAPQDQIQKGKAMAQRERAQRCV